jgi:hypothetical protein
MDGGRVRASERRLEEATRQQVGALVSSGLSVEEARAEVLRRVSSGSVGAGGGARAAASTTVAEDVELLCRRGVRVEVARAAAVVRSEVRALLLSGMSVEEATETLVRRLDKTTRAAARPAADLPLSTPLLSGLDGTGAAVPPLDAGLAAEPKQPAGPPSKRARVALPRPPAHEVEGGGGGGVVAAGGERLEQRDQREEMGQRRGGSAAGEKEAVLSARRASGAASGHKRARG